MDEVLDHLARLMSMVLSFALLPGFPACVPVHVASKMPGSEEMGLHRAYGQCESACHLLVRHLLEVAQDEDQAIVGWQLLQARMQKRLLFVLLNNILQVYFLATCSDALLPHHHLLQGLCAFPFLKLAHPTTRPFLAIVFNGLLGRH